MSYSIMEVIWDQEEHIELKQLASRRSGPQDLLVAGLEPTGPTGQKVTPEPSSSTGPTGPSLSGQYDFAGPTGLESFI